MKTLVRGILCAMLFTQTYSSVHSCGTATNKTFFSKRPAGVNLPMHMSTWWSKVNLNTEPFGGGLQVTPFYQASTNDSDLNKYFTFERKNTLNVGGTNADITPEHFNLPTNFEGHVSFAPEVKTYGVRIDFYQQLGNIITDLYFSMSAPIVHTNHDVRLREEISQPGTKHLGPNSMAEAFTGPRLTSDWSERWKYGKISGAQSITALADLDLRLGYNLFDEERYRIGLEFAVVAPTGNKATGEYMFEPMVGNGFHVGLGGGLNSRFNLWRKMGERNRLTLWILGDYRYLFRNTQKRTLELKDKNWGRFLRMRQQDPNDATKVLQNAAPGINVMTRSVRVTPGSQFDGMAYLDLSVNKWKFGLGYNIWAREAEKVRLRDDWDKEGTFGIASDTAAITSGMLTGLIPATAIQANGAISSETTINELKTGTATDKFIEADDVELVSHRSSLTHKIFGNISHDLDQLTVSPSYIGLGASYEFAENNRALEQWSVWGKFGIFF